MKLHLDEWSEVREHKIRAIQTLYIKRKKKSPPTVRNARQRRPPYYQKMSKNKKKIEKSMSNLNRHDRSHDFSYPFQAPSMKPVLTKATASSNDTCYALIEAYRKLAVLRQRCECVYTFHTYMCPCRRY